VTPFDVAMPASLPEALALLDPEDPAVRTMAGGTALMLMMKAGVFRPRLLISLAKAAPGLSGVHADASGNLTIGAMTTLSALERSTDIAAHAPVITRTMPRLSNVRVRNVATVGGALAHADPHMDLPPVLMALGASIRTASPSSERTLPIEELFTGYFETVLQRNELIWELHVPAQRQKKAAYLKVTTGSADDWPALGVAVVLEAEGSEMKWARIVVSAATEKATRLKTTERLLAGAIVDDKLLRRLGDAAVEEVETVGDVRGSAPYKRELLRVYVGRAVKAALSSDGALS
jgi:carbon-monoxide dehydrogenase medium subunit